MTISRLSPLASDILRETMNIGGAHAVNALARMVALPITIAVPDVALMQIESISDRIGASDEILSAILHHIAGDVSGYIVLSFTEADACTLAQHLQKEVQHLSEEHCMHTLSEMGNIISGSCFTSLNQFLNVHFSHSVPDATTDMSGALINSILAEMGQHTDDALVAQLDFNIESLSINGKVFLILDPDSTQRILFAAQKKLSHS